MSYNRPELPSGVLTRSALDFLVSLNKEFSLTETPISEGSDEDLKNKKDNDQRPARRKKAKN